MDVIQYVDHRSRPQLVYKFQNLYIYDLARSQHNNHLVRDRNLTTSFIERNSMSPILTWQRAINWNVYHNQHETPNREFTSRTKTWAFASSYVPCYLCCMAWLFLRHPSRDVKVITPIHLISVIWDQPPDLNGHYPEKRIAIDVS